MCKLSHPAVLVTHLQSTLLEYSLFDSSWYLRCPTQIHSVVAKEALNTFNLKIVKASMQRRRNGKVDFQQESKFFVEIAANGVRIVAQFTSVCCRGIVTAVNNTTMKPLGKLPITRKARVHSYKDIIIPITLISWKAARGIKILPCAMFTIIYTRHFTTITFQTQSQARIHQCI